METHARDIDWRIRILHGLCVPMIVHIAISIPLACLSVYIEHRDLLSSGKHVGDMFGVLIFIVIAVHTISLIFCAVINAIFVWRIKTDMQFLRRLSWTLSFVCLAPAVLLLLLCAAG